MNLEEFYEANPLRKRSGEVDFGVMWRPPLHMSWHHRVSWIKYTGEVYAYDGATGEVLVLGATPPNNREAIEAALEGWTNHIHDADSLTWVRYRLQLWNETHKEDHR
jgi:hypothetical protein